LLAPPRQRFDFAAHKLRLGFLSGIGGHGARLARGSGRLPAPQSLARAPRQRFDAIGRRLGRSLLANTAAHGVRFARLSSRLRPEGLARRAERARERLAGAAARARLAWANGLAARGRHLGTQEKLLASLGYRNVLARGYAVARAIDGGMKRRAAEIAPGERLDIEFADGRIFATADGEPAPSAGGESAPPRQTPPLSSRSPKKARGPGQGSLF